MTSLLTLEEVGLTLDSHAGKVKVLEGIHLTIHEGETLALVGPSGSGKTSLLMLLAGLEAPTTGKLQLQQAGKNHNLAMLREDERAGLRGQVMGIVFQSFHLIPTMTALENVMIPLEMQGNKEARHRAAEALQRVGLEHRIQHYPAELSGGEQQRVAIARAIASRPKLLLADEPTGNLDQANSENIMHLLFELQKEYGATLILVTHDSAIAKRCGRRVELRDGRILADTLQGFAA
jgi:putative ABC transport system ATP-binding protein